MQRAVAVLHGLLVVGALTGPGVASAQGAPPDFRALHWGMSPAAVRAAENAPLANDKAGVLIYRVQWLGLDTFISYQFSGGALFRAVVNVQEFHPAGADYVADYARIRAALTGRYGPPVAKREVIDPSRPLGPGSVWEPALLLNEVSRSARWEDGRTRVELTLKEVGHYLHFVVLFWRLPSGAAQRSTGSP